jgi:TPR repeat protein
MMRYWYPLAFLIALSMSAPGLAAPPAKEPPANDQPAKDPPLNVRPAKLRPNIRTVMNPILPAPKCEPAAAGPNGQAVAAKIAIDPAYDAFEKSCYKEALRLAEADAPKNGASNTLLGVIYEEGYGVPQNMGKAAEAYLQGAQLGDKYAQFAIGVMLAEGRGIKENKKQAAQFFEMAAAQNHATAIYNLAMLYAEGNGRPRDMGKAYELLERAAKLDNPAAQYDLAALYRGEPDSIAVLDQAERGVKKDERMAAYWLGKAAESGMTNAELEFGIALYLGKGVEPNEALAFTMIRRAAEKGNPIAQNRLAHAFAGGRGTKVDKIAAAKWHLLSRGAGVSDFDLDKFVLTALTPEERSRAEADANIWEQSTAALLQ